MGRRCCPVVLVRYSGWRIAPSAGFTGPGQRGGRHVVFGNQGDDVPLMPRAENRLGGTDEGERSGEGERRFRQRRAGGNGASCHALTIVSPWSFLTRSRISGLLSTPFSVSNSTKAFSVASTPRPASSRARGRRERTGKHVRVSQLLECDGRGLGWSFQGCTPRFANVVDDSPLGQAAVAIVDSDLHPIQLPRDPLGIAHGVLAVPMTSNLHVLLAVLLDVHRVCPGSRIP